ncbi:protein of unknown function [Tenacibaculum aestuariivivum]
MFILNILFSVKRAHKKALTNNVKA